MDLIRSFFKDSSRARSFYLHILNMTVSGEMKGHVDLLTRVKSICAHKDISFLKYIIDEKYARQCRSKMKNSFADDGVVDSVRQMLYFNDTVMINMLLAPF